MLTELPEGARVGTSSPRRRAQLLFLRPDLHIVSIRGNVETRLNQALEGRLDAILLAWAGLHRLGLDHHVTQRLDPSQFLPAVGQGALGIECRRDNAVTRTLLEKLDDVVTHRAVRAERAVLAALQGGCNLPLGAWARDITSTSTDVQTPALAISAAVFDPDGHTQLAVEISGESHGPRATRLSGGAGSS